MNLKNNMSFSWIENARESIEALLAANKKRKRNEKYDLFSLIGKVPSAYYAYYRNIINSTNQLIEGVNEGNLEKTIAAIKNGANLEIQDDSGRTPIFHTLRQDNSNITTILMAAKANLEAKDSNGCTPLNTYCAYGGNIKAALDLIAGGSNIHTTDNDGNTPLLHAVKSFSSKPHLGFIELLLQKGVDIHSADNKGNTPILVARDLSSVVLLLKYGANLTDRNARGDTILHNSFLHNEEAASYLLRGAAATHINTKNKDGKTPLLSIVSFLDFNTTNKLAAAKLLVQNGADIYVQDKYGKSTKDYLEKAKNTNFFAELEQIANTRNSTNRAIGNHTAKLAEEKTAQPTASLSVV